MRNGTSIFVLLILSLVAAPSPAQPGSSSPAPGSGASSSKQGVGPRNRGLMLKGSFGVTGCFDEACSDAEADPLVGIQVVALARLHRHFAAGLHLAFGFALPDDEGDQETIAYWSFILGLDVRGILPLFNDKLDLWVNLILGYGRAMWDFDVEVMNRTYEVNNWANAFAVGWGAGADYYINKNMAVGGSITHYRLYPRKYCTDSEDGKECERVSGSERQFFLGWWALMGTFTYFLPF